MKIITLVNDYPPYSDCGLPMLCKEAMEELQLRGHEILILTNNSSFGGKRIIEDEVWRIFEFCPNNRTNELKSGHLSDLWQWYKREWKEHALLQKALDIFCPDAIFVWSTWGLSPSLLIRLMHQPVPFFAYVASIWIKNHNIRAKHFRQYQFWKWGRKTGPVAWGKSLLHKILKRRIPLDYEPVLFDQVAFNSKLMEMENSEPIASRAEPVRICDSIPVEHFTVLNPPVFKRPIRILFIGHIHPNKDPLTLVCAFSLLQSKWSLYDVELTLIGSQPDLNYLQKLQDVITKMPAPEHIYVKKFVPYEAMPEVFNAHHILVVPSVLDALPRVAAEGMAAGLAVVISDQAGIKEHIIDGKHALVFPTGNASDLANCLRRIIEDRNLDQKLRQEGRKLAKEYFSTKRMVDELEIFLQEDLVHHRSDEKSQDKR